MLPSQQNKYLEASIQTASPQQLLIMLCDGAIRFCKAGIESTKKHNYEEANKNFCKVQDIVKEFMITLDQTAVIYESLMQLYDYFIVRLVEANTKKDTVPAEEVLGYLIELKETWFQAAKSLQTTGAGLKHG
jgi:flagellar secretion chaperone FliS